MIIKKTHTMVAGNFPQKSPPLRNSVVTIYNAETSQHENWFVESAKLNKKTGVVRLELFKDAI